MPGEIDRSGPRVLLHCVERADCPIPRSSSSSAPIVSFTCPAHRSSPARRDGYGPIGDDYRRAAFLGRSAEGSTVPGNDRRNGFFRDERSPPVSSTSSNGLGLADDRDRRGRRRSGAHLRRHLAARGGSPLSESRRRPVACHVREVSEITRDEVAEARPVDETGTGSSPVRLRNVEIGSPGAATCPLTRSRRAREDDRESLLGDKSAIVIRLFGCGDDRQSRPICPAIGERSAGISSQRSRRVGIADDSAIGGLGERTGDCRVECACEAYRSSGGSENASTERRGRHRSPQNRSYLQLALLLFLVAFGHNSLWKSGFPNGAGGRPGLGVLAIGTIIGTARALPVDLDAGVRAERSANLSHITGASRKIQMYIKNRHLQILPDGTVNGSNDDTSEYTIFQRTSVSRGQLRIQGVATCLYLCMDSCGLLYGSREYTDDCVFNETLEQHNYNTYSSVRWSTAKKTLYLGLNRRGQPRRVQAKGHNLGRLSAYARVLTQVASPDRVEALQARLLGAHHGLRHRHNSHHHRSMQQTACPSLPPQENDGRDKFRCRKRKKRKKRKRRCRPGERPGPSCEAGDEHPGDRAVSESSGEGPPQSKRSCEGAASEELCRRQALDAPAKKRKSRIEPARKTVGGREERQPDKRPKPGAKESKPKKSSATKKSNSTGRVENPEADPARRVSGPISRKRKPPSRPRSPIARRNNTSGRVPRTTLPTSPTTAVTLPSSWFPGATTDPTEASSWRRTKTPVSPKNSVTSGTLKTGDLRSSRNGKALVTDLSSESAIVDGAIETTEDHSAVESTLLDETSIEASEEARSDEFTQEDDPTTYPTLEYSTLMTTMDTTPPARTEDYTRATTESIHPPTGVGRGPTLDDRDSTPGERPRKFGRDLRLPFGRLAM